MGEWGNLRASGREEWVMKGRKREERGLTPNKTFPYMVLVKGNGMEREEIKKGRG